MIINVVKNCCNMTQNYKDMLLKDLCARLPYGVKVESVFINPETKEHKSWGIEVFDATSMLMIRDGLGEFKPYLFPLSSMTDEQKEIYCQLQQKVIYNSKGVVNKDVMNYINWCYENHLDVNDLIPMDLAIDATSLNIY